MFTVIDNEIYQVNEKKGKMIKVEIKNGAIKIKGEVEDFNPSSNLITGNELRRQYAKFFEKEEINTNMSDETLLKELDEKDKKIKELEDQIIEKDKTILDLNTQLDEAIQVLDQLKSANKDTPEEITEDKLQNNSKEKETPKKGEQK